MECMATQHGDSHLGNYELHCKRQAGQGQGTHCASPGSCPRGVYRLSLEEGGHLGFRWDPVGDRGLHTSL